MKLIAVLGIVCLGGTMIFAGTKGDLSEALTKYVKAGDRQSVSQISKITHPAFRVAFSMKGQKPVYTFTKSQVLDNFKAKKWGGKKRQVKISSIKKIDNVATVQARLLQNDGAVFHGSYTFVNEGKGWQLIQDTVVLELKK